MSGTKAGAAKAVATIKAKDPEFFKRIGSKGGSNGKGPDYNGGFASPDADPRAAGRLGGLARGYTKRKAADLEVTSTDTVPANEYQRA